MAAASGIVTQNRPGTKAKVRFARMSASKARVVLNLIRGRQVEAAAEILQFSERLAAEPIAKCLNSAVANAEHNEDITADELFVSACFADEGPTLKRYRPRARGRAGRIHKQTCHITIEVSRLTDDELDEARRRDDLKAEGRQTRASKRSSGGADRSRRVAKSRAAQAEDTADTEEPTETDEAEETIEDQAAEDQAAESATTEEEVTEDQVAEEEAAETTEDTAESEAGATDEVATDEDPDADAGVN